MGTERDDPFLASLAPHDQCLTGFIDVADVDADQFAHTDARGVERFEHGPVAGTEHGAGVRSGQQSFDVVDADGLGQPLGLPYFVATPL